MTNAVPRVSVAAAVMATLLFAAPLGAQQAAGTTPTISPQGTTVDTYVVGQARPPDTGQTLLNMTLDDAMALALENNLNLKVARMNPEGVDYQLQAARAAYMPRFTGTYSYTDATSTSNFTLDGVNQVNSLNQSFNGSFSQATPWYGGSLSVSFNNSRSASDQITNRFNPSYSTSMRMNYTQPLLANRRIDNTRNTLRTLQITREISDIQLLTTVENTMALVRTAYWALRGAIEQIEIQRLSLSLAQRQFEDNKIRVEIGTMAPIETTTSETQVANAEQALLNAEIGWRTSELVLKHLLASGPGDEIYGNTINPVDLPVLEPPSVDLQAAITRALAERTDLIQSRRSLDITRLNLEVSQNATLPTLNLTAGYNLQGTAGAYTDALSLVQGLDNPALTLSLNFTYPLGMRQAKANFARSQLQLEQAEVQLQTQELNINTQVTNAGWAVENTYLQLGAASKSREAAERNAEAEQVRFDNGLSDNYNVALALNSLTNARLTELSRLISYVNAVAEFERVQRVGG